MSRNKRPLPLIGWIDIAHGFTVPIVRRGAVILCKQPATISPGGSTGSMVLYPAKALWSAVTSTGPLAVDCVLVGRTQPAESHDSGTENSDHPQSRHIRTSGDGVMGGWLVVRSRLR
jgi:hypothetical protein